MRGPDARGMMPCSARRFFSMIASTGCVEREDLHLVSTARRSGFGFSGEGSGASRGALRSAGESRPGPSAYAPHAIAALWRLHAFTFVMFLTTTIAVHADDSPQQAPSATASISAGDSSVEGTGQGVVSPPAGTGEAEDLHVNTRRVSRRTMPLVLVHGFSGFADVGPVDYFFRIVDDLRGLEHKVYTPTLPPYRGSKARAQALAQSIDLALAETGATQVHVIAHSQGGIDARSLLGMHPEYRAKIFSITTIGTPHRGTPIADEALSTPDAILFPAGDLLSWLIGFTNLPEDEKSWDSRLNGIPKEFKSTGQGPGGDIWSDPRLREAIEQLSTAGMREFNRAHPLPDEVHVFSVAAYSNLRAAPHWCGRGELFPRTERVDLIDFWLMPSGLFLMGNRLMHPVANDGVVPSKSMVWGSFLGCIPADHFDQVGMIGDTLPHVISGFDHIRFYRKLVRFLRRLERREREQAQARLMPPKMSPPEVEGISR